MTTTPSSTATPNTADQIADKETVDEQLCRQLFNLQNGQQVKLLFEDENKTPDYHSEENIYTVVKTVVKHDDGEESHYNIYLTGKHINTMEGPHFKIQMSRRASWDMGWYLTCINGTTGKNKWGNKEYHYHKATLEGVIVTTDAECCSKCGQKL